MASETKLWHAVFYFNRGIRGSTGRPLYSYRVTDQEFSDLKDALRTEGNSWSHPVLRDRWAACYAMYVAESYRRHYDPAIGWAWAVFDGPLGLLIPAPEKGPVVLNGLKYWGRPVRRFDNGNNDYLGSLFAEGGLPWSLLNTPIHGFGRAVRSGVRHFDEDRESGRSVATRIAEFRQYFPQSFRTDEVGLLLVGIVTQLISIVGGCRVRVGEDPIAVLDRDMPTWRDDFPIPLDDVNANQLISDWLTAARQGREDWAQRVLDRASNCAHRLSGNATSLDAVLSIVDLQRQVAFPMPARGLTGTRLELGCYEGDRLAQRLGVAYAEQEGDVIRIRNPKASIEVRRDNVELPLSIKVLDAGEIIHSLPVPNSSFDRNVAPTVFEFREDWWWFLSAVTCTTKADRVRIRIPAGWETKSGRHLTLVAEDQASWIEASSALSLIGFGEEISVGFGDNGVSAYRLVGAVSVEGARPELVALGWPRIERDGAGDAEANLVNFVNGRSRQALAENQDFGVVKYQLRTATGLTIFRKKFGLLPADFRLRLSPAGGHRHARVAVTSRESLVLTVTVGSGEPVSWNHEAESLRDLPSSPGLGRSEVSIAVHSRGNPDPVVLRRPYPLVGVQVTKADGTRINGGTLTLEDLPGMEAVFYAGPGGATFRVALELVGIRGATPSQYFNLRVGDEPVRIHVNSYADDIAMLLGVSSDQDARVRMSFESGVRHCTFEVCRYKYEVLRLHEASAVIVAATGSNVAESEISLLAMCLPEPGSSPVPLREMSGSSLGHFDIPELENDGPWILCAPPGSRIGCRPLFVRGNPEKRIADEIGDFGTAIRQLESDKRAVLIAEQVVLMATDAGHPGWDHLRSLKDGYSHLPLAVFEIWKAVAANSNALVLAVLRLDLSLEFCRRIESELAVVWESVPLPAWRGALETNASWLRDLGLSSLLLDQVRDAGIRTFKQLWPGFNDLGGYLTGAPLRAIPILAVLPAWHQALRQQQAQNDHWPTQCATELRAWALAQRLPEAIMNLPTHNFMNSVTYLPMFLGFVSAGRGSLSLPGVPVHFLKHAVRHVANFDQHWFAPAHAVMTCHFAQND